MLPLEVRPITLKMAPLNFKGGRKHNLPGVLIRISVSSPNDHPEALQRAGKEKGTLAESPACDCPMSRYFTVLFHSRLFYLIENSLNVQRLETEIA